MSRKKVTLQEGFYAFPEIAAFLSGLFFTILLLIIQSKDDYSDTFTFFKITISNLFIITTPIMLTSILFLFATIFSVLACMASTDRNLSYALYSTILFFIGIFFMLVSIFVIFLLLNIWMAVVSLLLSLLLLYGGFAIDWTSLSSEE